MVRTASRWVCVVVVGWGCFTGLARGDDAPLANRIEDVTNQPIYKHAHWGILVVDLESSETVYELNADKLFVPASTTKLFSTAAALDAFGSDYRFRTPVYQRGTMSDAGELRGDLILVATGDLSFGGRTDPDGRIAFADSDHTYANGSSTAAITKPDPLAGLNNLAQQVQQAGIKRVNGDVLVDDRYFEPAEGSGSGPSRLTPIMVNDNLIDIVVSPAHPGEKAEVRWRPETSFVQIDAQVDSVGAGGTTRVQITSPATGRIVVRGKIASDHKPVLRVVEVEHAASFARSLFVEALHRAGVSVSASPLALNRTDQLPDQATYAAMKRVAELESPPFAESIRLILKVSHNLHASTLPLLVGAKHGKRTLADGLQLQHDFLSRVGIDVDTISFGGGAGGSRADYTTPRATVQLLRYMTTRPDFECYESALPLLGVDGTLASVVGPDSPARGHVMAKTGTLYWDNVMNDRVLLTSKALAGYMRTSAGRRLAFALFVNNTHLEKASETVREGKTLGRLCEIIYTNH